MCRLAENAFSKSRNAASLLRGGYSGGIAGDTYNDDDDDDDGVDT